MAQTSNTMLTPTIIAREALMHLRNELVLGSIAHRQYKKEFTSGRGTAVTIRKPVKMVTDTTEVISTLNNVIEESITFNVDQRRVAHWAFDSLQMTLTVEEYSERYIKPAAIRLANDIDVSLAGLHTDLYQNIGVANQTPDTFAVFGAAGQKLDEASAPRQDRHIVLNPAARWSMADALKGLLAPQMVEGFVKNGKVAELADFTVHTDQNIANHTVGTIGSTLDYDTLQIDDGGPPAEADAALDMDYLNGTTGLAFAVGDKFTMAGVNSVNPVSKADTGQLQQFTVTTANTASTRQFTAVPFSPTLYTTSHSEPQLATVSALPADDAAVTPVTTNSGGTFVANLAVHKNCLGLVTVPLWLPESATFKARITEDGISLRVVRDFDILNDQEVIRIDVQYGVKTLYPELGAVLLG